MPKIQCQNTRFYGSRHRINKNDKAEGTTNSQKSRKTEKQLRLHLAEVYLEGKEQEPLGPEGCTLCDAAGRIRPIYAGQYVAALRKDGKDRTREEGAGT